MVSIKEATGHAIAFAREALGPERTDGVRLEEVESATVDGSEAWLITLSMFVQTNHLEKATESIADMLGTRKREYKTFTVLKDNGEVKSMKIRELAGA